MATFTFGRTVDIHWNGFEVVGPAGTVFSIPDQLYEEFNDDILPVEPTLTWIDTNEFLTLSNSVSVSQLQGTFPISVTTTTSGRDVSISSSTNPAGYNLVADGTGGVIFQAASTGALTSIVGVAPMSTIISGNTASVILNASYQTAGTYVNAVIGTSPASVLTASGTSTVSIDQAAITGATAATNAQVVRFYVKNTTGSTIPKGSAVYVSGATGDNALISLASATSDPSSSKTLGITSESIANDAFGYVVESGYLTDIDTSATTAGAAVWLGNTPGSLVFVSPPAEPSHAVYLGVVVRVQSMNGSILVKVQNGYELDELHDVFVGGVSTALPLVYNSTSSGWVAQALTSVGIADNAIVAAKIDAGAVTSAKIAAGAVNSAALADNAVVAAKIAAAAVGTVAISSGSATSGQILQANGSGGATFATLTAGISASTFSAKGDILTASASGVLSVLNVGSDGKVIVADSNQASGLKYGSLAVLSSPASNTILNGSTTPWRGPQFQNSGAGRGKYATDGTTYATITNELMTASMPGNNFIRAAFLSAILNGGAQAFTATTSIAYGNGIWVVAYRYASQNYLRLAYSTNLSTWTDVSNSDVYSFTASSDTHTDIIYCDTSTGSKTFLWSLFNTSQNLQRMYALSAESITALNAGMTQVWDQGTNAGSSQPIMLFSRVRNQWYALSSHPTNTQPALLRWGTPNGTSTTQDGSQNIVGSVFNNPYNNMMMTNDEDYLYVSVSNNFSTNSPYRVNLPITGGSATVTGMSGTFGTRYGTPGYWCQSGNKIAYFGGNTSQNGTIDVTILNISANTTTTITRYESAISSNDQINGKNVKIDANTNVYMAPSNQTWLLDDGTDNVANAAQIMNLSGMEKFTHNSYIYHATKSSGLAGPAQLYGWGLVAQPRNTSQTANLAITGATDHGNVNIIASSDGQIWTSASTSNWTLRTSQFAGTRINSLSSNNTVAVAVGNSGKISYSTDTAGSTWTIATSGTTQNLNQVAYGAGKFVAVGAAGTMIQSSNGTSWSSISGPFGTSVINTVVYHPRLALFAAAGAGGLLATSSNGTSWTLRTTGISSTIHSIAVGLASMLLGYNQSSTNQPFRISYDGTTWTEIILSAYGITGYNDGYTSYTSGPTHGAYIMQYKYSNGTPGSYYINKDYSDTLGNGSVIVL